MSQKKYCIVQVQIKPTWVVPNKEKNYTHVAKNMLHMFCIIGKYLLQSYYPVKIYLFFSENDKYRL